MAKETREQIARKAWLHYFNTILRERGLLMPQEYRAMSYEWEDEIEWGVHTVWIRALSRESGTH